MRLLPLSLALVATPALAQLDGLPDPATFDARVAACVPGHTHGAIVGLRRLLDGETVEGTFKDGKKVLFSDITSDDCDSVYPVGKAAARVRGTFDAKGEITKAFIMTQSAGNCPGEDEGGCSQLLVLKDKAGAYRAAAVFGACAQPELRATPLFSKAHQGVIVHCRRSGGGDQWAHLETLVGFTATGIKEMVEVKLGFSESAMGDPSVAKRPDSGARCEYAPPGLLKVVSYGEKPGIVAREASFSDPEAAPLHGRRVWDGKTFVPNGAPIPIKEARKVVCHDKTP